MKVEIGESLIYSFLRHEKNCLITQTNWKPSGNWNISQEVHDRTIYEFDKINKHHAFSEIFKSDIGQTIKQAEIDVLGIDQSNKIYAFEVAFHENGLQYGGKIETRNRIFKKLLRGYITLKCYFPNHQHFIAFCSPKVNIATEQYIKDYFEVLIQDFQTDDTEFYYFSNEKFNSEIAQKTLAKTITEADSSELFTRSIKLFNIFSKFNSSFRLTQHSEEKLNTTPETPKISPPASSQTTIKINDISVPLKKDDEESVQDYVKRIMRLLLNNNALSSQEIERLKDKDYCKKTFHLYFPLLRNVNEDYQDPSDKVRYWSKETFGGNYYVCSQWWKDRNATYLTKLTQWLLSLSN